MTGDEEAGAAAADNGGMSASLRIPESPLATVTAGAAPGLPDAHEAVFGRADASSTAARTADEACEVFMAGGAGVTAVA